MDNIREIFTIGHSNHSKEFFLELLQSQSINCLIDVRSNPASRHNPQFNKQPLDNFLKQHRITYMHFGEQFGARHDDSDIMDEEGIVDFEIFRKSFAFKQGVERVETGLIKGFKICLMCSEGNPLECHRFSMISVYMEEIGIHVKHILKDKSVKTQVDLEKDLLKKYEMKLPRPSLFEPDFDARRLIKHAYKLHNKEIGWQSEKDKLSNESYDRTLYNRLHKKER